ncbi:cytochrome P450 [Propylenella binzhouense]|uniref:Cytochrome P450 n=1 Tax=Propylenella binzhouense TaxID=2555902 RepID=A0A964T194_9HYPH|nr:cytochrome P450 [Propylenella binzhouense]MYZ46571.1 cytochrome P450 [Propylenella binzhouense]
MTAALLGTQDLGEGLHLEDDEPVWMPVERAWRVSRYVDVDRLLRHPAVEVIEMHQRIARLGASGGRDYASLSSLLAATLFYRNAAFHTDGRRFLLRTMAELRNALSEPALRRIARAIVGEAREGGRTEAMQAICMRMPLAVMTEALGLSPATGEAIAASGGRIIGAWLPALPMRILDLLQTEAATIERLIEEDMRTAAADGTAGLALMMRLNADGFGFTPRQIAGLAFFLVFAGVETTSAFMGAALHQIHAHPDVEARLRADPALIAPALAEVLRLAGPVRRVNGRVLGSEITLGGRSFEAGTALAADLERANHDPAVFPDPARFDIDRRGPASFGFGVGAHACIGAALARLETRILVEEILSSARVELVDPTPRWQQNPAFRRLERLDLILRSLPE